MGFADALIRVLRGVVGVVLWVLCEACDSWCFESSWLRCRCYTKGVAVVVLTVLWLLWVKFEGHCVVGSVLWVAWGHCAAVRCVMLFVVLCWCVVKW